jgi:23S rRNA (uracil1939-C5)-methyltransferase
MAPFVLPRERAEIEVVSQKTGMLRGRVMRVLEPNPDRVPAACPHFGICGGCHYQHLNYAAQLEAKAAILTEVFQRVGKISAPEQIRTISGPEWGYRNRVQLHIDGARIGFHEASSHRVRGVDACPVASPMLNQAIAALKPMLRQRNWPRFLKTIELFTNEQQVQLNVLDSGPKHVNRAFFEACAKQLPGAMEPTLDYPAAGFLFRVSYNSFFQVNRFLLDELVSAALEGAEGEKVLDLYAGAGLFSLPLARRGRPVTAVESSASACADLEHNAQRANLPVKVVRAQCEQGLTKLDERPDFVLADPPRAGLGKQVVQRLIELQPPRITVVSCDPPTLARDLAALIAGGYKLEALTLVDLFPHTAHMESIARLMHS